MAHVKDNPALACCKEELVGLALLIKDRKLLGVDMGVDIAGAHLFENQLLVAAFGGAGPEVDHQRFVTELTGGNATINRGPWWMFGVPR